jgi:hypothetical protein
MMAMTDQVELTTSDADVQPLLRAEGLTRHFNVAPRRLT